MSDDDSGRLHRLFGEAASDEVPAPASALKGQIAALLWEKRYEEALEQLYAARWHSPGAAEISRGINLLKERLIRGYVEDLGNLDAVPSIGSGLDLTSL